MTASIMVCKKGPGLLNVNKRIQPSMNHRADHISAVRPPNSSSKFQFGTIIVKVATAFNS